MGHLVAQDGELVHLHRSLVLAIDAAVGDQASGRDHVGRHAVTDEQDDVLGLTLFGDVTDDPIGSGCLVVVVGQSGLVLTRLVESNLSVGLGGDIDERGLARILGKEIY